MRIRYILVFVILFLSEIVAKGQTVYDKYVDFNDAIVQHHPDLAMALATQILNSSEKLPSKTQTKFYAFLAKLYENDQQVDNAIKYYELVVAAEPDYYIAHRALGYLYLGKAQSAKLNPDARIALQENNWRGLAITHLEKDEACNPDKDELETIKNYYNGFKDKTALKTLDARLKQLAGKCVDLLTD